MKNRNRRTRTAALATTALMLLVPTALLAPGATAVTPCVGGDSPFQTTGHVTLGSPLAEQITVADLLVLAFEDSAVSDIQQLRVVMNEVNGLDAYVIQLPCSISSGAFTLTGTDNGLELYDLGIWWVGEIPSNRVLVTDEASRDINSEPVPPGGPFEYVVVFTDGGLPNGIRVGGVPNVYSVLFQFRWES